MAGRAATAVKSKAKATKPRSASKAPKRKLVAPSASTEVSVDATSATVTMAAPVKSRRRVKAEVCTRIYWAVFNQLLKRVAVFEFDQKKEAEKRAAALMKSSGEYHFISKIKATVPKES